MKNPVIIKSSPNGLVIYLDSDMPFDELIKEVASKFLASAKFFNNAKMAVSFEGRILKDNEEQILVDTITENTNIEILCVIGKDDDTDKTFVHAMTQLEFHKTEIENYCQFYKGNITDNKVYENYNSIIILGDVYPGCTVFSDKDIVIIGGLYGQAYAGCNNEPGHFIIALDMNPEKLRIGDYRLRIQEKGKWGIKQKVNPKIAYIKDNEVVCENISKELWDKLDL